MKCTLQDAYAETKAYRKIPIITNFVDENGVDRMKEMIKEITTVSNQKPNKLLLMNWNGFVMMRACGICCLRRKNRIREPSIK